MKSDLKAEPHTSFNYSTRKVQTEVDRVSKVEIVLFTNGEMPFAK